MTMKVLVTAGPTQEPIDDVRYVTNASSGKMGAAIANEAMKRGYGVTLVHGPVQIKLPDCKKIAVRTTEEMIKEVEEELKHKYGVLVSTAAISDYSPKKKKKGKIKSGQKLSLEFKTTPKLINKARKGHPDLFIVGFKAEHGMRRDELKVTAENFLKKKKLDMVVANDIEKNAFGSDESDIIIASKESTKDIGKKRKSMLAKRVWDEIELNRMNAANCPV